MSVLIPPTPKKFLTNQSENTLSKRLEKKREIALEITLLGQSGLEAIRLMYADFKRVAHESAVGMNLDEPFLTALELFHSRAGKTQPEQG